MSGETPNWSPEQKEARPNNGEKRQVLSHETAGGLLEKTKIPNLREDSNGLYFYKVQSGDSINGIIDKLVAADPAKFGYLKEMRITNGNRDIKGFCTPPGVLTPGMELPIPLSPEAREIKPEQLWQASEQAISEMLAHPKYKDRLNTIIQKIGKPELVTLINVVAEIESGMGTYSFHRYEGGSHKTWSYSAFHVLASEGSPGDRAFKSLKLTPGDSYDTKNAAKLFLAFLLEKRPPFEFPAYQEEDLAVEADLPEFWSKDLRYFADLYNGAGWRDHFKKGQESYPHKFIRALKKFRPAVRDNFKFDRMEFAPQIAQIIEKKGVPKSNAKFLAFMILNGLLEHNLPANLSEKDINIYTQHIEVAVSGQIIKIPLQEGDLYLTKK